MTTETAYPGDDPHRLLSNTRELAQRVRRAQRATWFPLLVFAILTFASIPVRRYSGHHLDCVTVPRVCTVYSNAEFVYWPIALVLAYVVIATLLHPPVPGPGRRALALRPYAAAGVIVAAALTGAWRSGNCSHPSASGPAGLQQSWAGRLASPGCGHRARAAGAGLGGTQPRPAPADPRLPGGRAGAHHLRRGPWTQLSRWYFGYAARVPGQRAAARRHRLRPGPAAVPGARPMTGPAGRGHGPAIPPTGSTTSSTSGCGWGILTIAHEARRVEFGYLRTNLELSAGNLSQHLGAPENAGLITLEKGYAGQARPDVGHPHESGPGRPRRGDRPAQTPDQPHRQPRHRHRATWLGSRGPGGTRPVG